MRPVTHTENEKFMDHSGIGEQIILKRILNTALNWVGISNSGGFL
jgi:hypothetical protein